MTRSTEVSDNPSETIKISTILVSLMTKINNFVSDFKGILLCVNVTHSLFPLVYVTMQAYQRTVNIYKSVL